MTSNRIYVKKLSFDCPALGRKINGRIFEILSKRSLQVNVAAGYFIAIGAGLILGSFATALVHRVPAGLSWGRGRSVCPACGTTLQPADLVPVLSWLLSKGRCRYCATAIPASYPLTELGVAAAALAVFLTHGLSAETFFILAALPFLAALLAIDLKHMILPNRLVMILGIIGFVRLVAQAFVFHGLDPALIGYSHILGFFLYGSLAWLLKRGGAALLKKDALGGGDVKFFAVAGLWLGLTDLAAFCVLSGLLGILLAGLWRGLGKGGVFPFGPALILSLYALLLA
jgi:leader peptidase (prepilin peptidase) / N-methyltransferase